MKMASDSFEHNSLMPKKHSYDGGNLSPALTWSETPDATKSLSLICDDPDAPAKTWVHWVIYGIPADQTSLMEGFPAEAQVKTILQGQNDFGQIGYGGTYPPPGSPHRYHFTLYALDNTLELDSGATKEELLQAMEEHMLEKTQIIGLYKR